LREDTLKRANELTLQIKELEDFMFWCSGKREGFRTYPMAVIGIKRRWHGGISSKEYEVTRRLQEKLVACIQEELDLLNAERDNL